MAIQSVARIGNYLGMAKDGWLLRRAQSDAARSCARQHLADRMGRMRGIPQKLGQIVGFSHRSDDVSRDFESLQEQSEPMPLCEVEPILEEQWGQSVDRVVVKIETQAKSASLGQVHRAVLHDGRDVAIKVQYPGIRDAVMLDLKMLGWLSLPVGNLDRGFDIPAYRDTILEGIDQELDYRSEAAFQRRFATWAANHSFLDAPEVIAPWCTPTVLVSQWEEGDHWHDVQARWSRKEKQRLAQGLVDLFHESLFQRGLLHADWHPGNLRFRRSGGEVRVLFYDFGSVYEPLEQDQLSLLRLIRAACRQDESPYALFMKLGFRDEYLQSMEAKLPALCNALFEPYASDYPFDVSNWQLGQRVGDILGNDRWNFRIAGPPQLIFLMRAFHGLLYYLEGLQVSASWSRVIGPLFDEYDKQLNELQLPSTEHEHNGFEGLAKNLRIRVTENGRTKVLITHRAAAIDHLETLIDESLKQRIEGQGVVLGDLVASVRRRGYAPGDVFRLTDETKEIAVWLD